MRGYRRFPNKRMIQVVIYLTPTTSKLVYQTTFEIPDLRYSFTAIRLWEHPIDTFLRVPGLLPFAVLGQTSGRLTTLQTVAQAIEQLPETRERDNVSAAILAGLVLGKDAIRQLLKEDLEKESVIYQDILAQGEVKGEAKSKRNIARNLLSMGIAIEPIAQATGLSVEQVRELRSPQ